MRIESHYDEALAGQAVDLAERYGLQRFCRGVHGTDTPVLELGNPAACEVIAQACRAAVAADGSEAIVLGCAGMADLCAYLTHETGVPVIDGVAAATLNSAVADNPRAAQVGAR